LFTAGTGPQAGIKAQFLVGGVYKYLGQVSLQGKQKSAQQ